MVQICADHPWNFIEFYGWVYGILISVTLWLFNIAMENAPFIDGLPIKHGDFPWLCLIARW